MPCSPRLLAILGLAIGLLGPAAPASAALLDVWRADDLNLNEGDLVGTWPSVSNRTANAVSGERPIFRLNATPAGSAAVRFDGTHRMSIPAASNPAAARTSFSVAIVFRAARAGAGNSAQWWGKTGLVDAEEPGVTLDWGTVLTETGQVGIGTGNPDVTTYSTGASLVGTNYHAAVFTWGGGVQTVHVDDRTAVVRASVSTTRRNTPAVKIGDRDGRKE